MTALWSADRPRISVKILPTGGPPPICMVVGDSNRQFSKRYESHRTPFGEVIGLATSHLLFLKWLSHQEDCSQASEWKERRFAPISIAQSRIPNGDRLLPKPTGVRYSHESIWRGSVYMIDHEIPLRDLYGFQFQPNCLEVPRH